MKAFHGTPQQVGTVIPSLVRVPLAAQPGSAGVLATRPQLWLGAGTLLDNTSSYCLLRASDGKALQYRGQDLLEPFCMASATFPGTQQTP